MHPIDFQEKVFVRLTCFSVQGKTKGVDKSIKTKVLHEQISLMKEGRNANVNKRGYCYRQVE